MHSHDNKPISVVLHEIKDELQQFFLTRVDMLRAEMNDKVTAWKAGVPMLVGAIVLGWSAFLVFSFGLVALLATLIDSRFSWAIGAALVFALYLVVAAVFAWMGIKELKAEGVAPKRTLRVLQQDQAWIKNEARSA